MENRQETIENLISANATKTRFQRRENSKAHNSYQLEKLINEAVRQGDLQNLSRLINIPDRGVPGTLSRAPLRNMQNLFIAGITLYTRSAIEGGLPVEEAFNLSDTYINISENSSTVSVILKLQNKALMDFTGRVAEIQRKKYSPYIEKAMDYIYKNLHNDFSQIDLATHVNLSPAYFSRLFHRESGMSPSSYIQRERVHAAQNMLRFSNYSYSDIANYLNFNSQSYFISVFKKQTGMTPMQYRRQNLPSQN